MPCNRMEEFIRTNDWTQTPLGGRDSWPKRLAATVQIILDSKYPMFIWWGEHLINLYNDAYIPVLGNRHPNALGEAAPIIWSDIWDVIGTQVRTVFEEGCATWNEELPLFMRRNGFLEETFFTFSYSPIKNDQGEVLGLFCACTEETGKVLKGRRLHTLREISSKTERSDSVNDVCRLSAEVMADNPYDIPFSLLYLWDDEEHGLRLEAQSGLQAGSAQAPAFILADGDDLHPQPWWPVLSSSTAEETEFSIDVAWGLPGGAWPEPSVQGMVLTLPSWGQGKKAGYLIVGTSPRLLVDDSYREFLILLARGISGSINRARSLTEERKRIESLAELNRAKTEFFSNVSHEFRTPLTLILGSLNELMQPGGSAAADTLEVAHRNTLRMLKLVNTLLDFSSLEAGRMKAEFEPVDLSKITKELASNFESAMKKAGLDFHVVCPPLSQPVFVDRGAWEKIILNLLSNALKFTLQGRVSLEVSQDAEGVEVRVRDSGVGISSEALSRVFERFYRAPKTSGRSFEGTGIGLALVKELVQMHGGRIEVHSECGKGSVFTITLPFGSHHLPADQVRSVSTPRSNHTLVQSFVLESAQWVPEAGREQPSQAGGPEIMESRHGAHGTRPLVLLVDDNRDMQKYITRLLRTEYDVVCASDGQEALERLETIHPHLILSDIMMPRVDGLSLLTRLRCKSDFQSTPFIVLSARAGQEAEVDGLLTGADDYIVKPFSARELLARVKKTLALATMRRAAIEYESRFQHLAHHPEIMTWMTDKDGNCLFLSQTWFEFTGQTEAAGLGEGWLSVVHPDDRASVREAFLASHKARQPLRHEYRIRGKEGTYHWVLDSASPRFSVDGEYLGYTGLVLDLSFQKDSEEKIRESEERFRMLANTISQFAWMADSSGWIFWYNQRWFDYTGTTLEEMQGWGWQRVHHPEHVKRVVEKVSHCFQTGQIWEDTFPLLSKDGEYRWFLSRAIPIRDQNGTVVRWMGTNTDITDLQTTQQELQELTSSLERRIAERTEELKQNQSRLQGLIGELILTEQRERRRIAEELHDFLAQMLVACRLRVKSVEQMTGEEPLILVLHEIDRILDQSLAYTRSLVVQLVPSVVYQFGLLEGLKWLADDMKQHALSVEVHMEPEHLSITENEAVLMFQSVRELLMNVLKHSGVDRARLGISITPFNEVRIEVVDEGIGFDPYLTDAKKPKSTQFGLFSIRERMTLLGGRMDVISSPGSGARIRLYLPLSRQDRERAVAAPVPAETLSNMRSAPAPAPRQAGGIRVVLADDHAVVRQGLKSLLESFSEVDVVGEAGDGLEAVGLAAALNPDVVVMDINMPRMDGIQATRTICQNHPGICVIGLSVRQDNQTEQAMRAAGAAGYMSKESAGGELYQLIVKLVDPMEKHAL